MNNSIKKLRKVYVFFIKILSFFIPIKKNKVTLVRKHFSGSNVTPVYYELRKYKNINVELIDHNPYKPNLLLRELKLYFKLLRSRIIVTTHGAILKTKRNITIDLWHGTTIKSMNLMNKSKKDVPMKDLDYFCSYSNFFNTIYNSCFGLNIQNYVTLGSPRNDYLFTKNKDKIKSLMNWANNQKILFYMPTYRAHFSGNYSEFTKNLGFDKFDLIKFNNFLKQNNFLLVLKPHPENNILWKKLFKKMNLSNFRLLLQEDLISKKIKLYELLSVTDLLITDYSSVYADYLLLNKPIIFLPTDIEEYRRERGFVLEPYDFWTPGFKCFNQKQLESSIKKSLNNINYYKKERTVLKSIFHEYEDSNSSKRVAKFILDKLDLS